MKRTVIVRQILGPVILLAMIGCQGPADTAQTEPAQTDSAPSDSVAQTEMPSATDTVPGDGEGVILVSLKVPNMH